ncbi:MAG TPA: ATP-binding protein, partial [candidate division Zixibacteria bacterium]|nr:ATP-binding protein [candidate division Zixibacteria bacterium]
MAAPKRKRQKRLALTPEAVADLFPRGSSVLVGLSGGADSVALTHLLSQLIESRQLTVSACHINHHLRGVESAADSDFCEVFCDQLEIPYIYV